MICKGFVREFPNLISARSGSYALRVGEIDVLVVSDGVLSLPGAMLGHNAEARVLCVSRTQGDILEVAEDCEIAVTVHKYAPLNVVDPCRPVLLPPIA